ncbi:hypothetical protein [Intestinimonas butyriciproducens]|uniref:hypothetical protein n=1 Tax=Intestinimonas butyriciproducens TaxID=1297617 RepID=UPI00195C20A2|nr:hypothetical protein [Intestinimonas butyriciproducens]MBM6917511.1 hypothetical protein [Intestinimonas butyriciproducens]
MALPDQELNTVLDRFNQKCLEDPDFARLAQEDPISAFDTLAKAHEAHLTALDEAAFPLAVPGQKLSMEELAQVLCQ